MTKTAWYSLFTLISLERIRLIPGLYTEILREKIIQQEPRVWPVYTGWIHGPFGKGYRIPLEFIRAIIDAAINNNFSNEDYLF
jgi:phosphoenolpyruvate carboxykinase (ATP)